MSGVIAGGSTDSYTPNELFAGEKQIVTKAFIVATGLSFAANSVFALNGSDELVEWVPGAGDSTGVAVAVSCEAIDTSGGASSHPMYVEAYFNTDAIQWPDGTTDSQKLNAFVNTGIQHRQLGYSG